MLLSSIGGVAGAFIGGVTYKFATFLHEEDVTRNLRLLNAYIVNKSIDYLLNEEEINSIIYEINEIESKDMIRLFENIQKSYYQEKVIDDFLEPIFNKVTNKRDVVVIDEEKISRDLSYAI